MRWLRVTGLVMCLLALLGAVWFVAGYRYGVNGLRPRLIERQANIGIPGVSKMYEAVIANEGLLPARITRCDYVDDTLSPGQMVAYAVQRWDSQKQRWETLVGLDRETFCKPYPLGIVKAELVEAWLWPGQSLSAGDEATAARGGFDLGDHARFVIFLREAGDYARSVTTQAFTIDERPTIDVDLRVRH